MQVLTATSDSPDSAQVSPLEIFLRDYVETTGGAWEAIEPQVYDLLPAQEDLGDFERAARDGILRVTFDPEALPEHPGAQLASLGTPLVDRLLDVAVQRGRRAHAFVNGLNLSPHNLEGRILRKLRLPDKAELEFQQVRALDFGQAVYWFEVTFASDQKEQEILPIAIDLHTGRQVRHLEQLLDFSRLAEEPAEYRLEAGRMSAAAAFPMAREQILRTISSLANLRRRELTQRVEKQIDRMRRYYSDLRSEIQQQRERAEKSGKELDKFGARLATLSGEERLRITELRQKSTLRVRLRLISLLLVRQPKLLVKSILRPEDRIKGPSLLELVWDPLTECLEAVTCPRCQSPTYDLKLTERRRLTCPQCNHQCTPGAR